MNNKKTFYLTTSIAYTNSQPHIGYAVELLQADTLARFYTLQNKEVCFVTGTDEHGVKIQKTAQEKGLQPQVFVDQISAQFKKLTEILQITNTDFIRTSDKKRHYPAAQKIWQQLQDAGDIYSKTYQGKYCVGCEVFLNDRDLIDNKCPYHHKEPELINEQNYFFCISKYLPIIEQKILQNEIEIVPENRKKEALNILKEAQKEQLDISFSRPKNILHWGVPIPHDDNQTMYVWCDALTNYISALGYADANSSEQFSKFWPADIHIIGKDILKFHAIFWPAMLLSANLPLPKKIFVHGFITVDGQKMSKSLGNVIDPFEVIEKYGTEVTRYYLLKEISPTNDSDFSYQQLEKIYASDLQNGLGNLVARVLTMWENYFPDYQQKPTTESLQNIALAEQEQVASFVNNLESYYQTFQLDTILENTSHIIKYLDTYIQIHQPFKLIKNDPIKTAAVLYTCLQYITLIGWLIIPFLPKTAEKILQQIIPDTAEREKVIQSLNKTYKTLSPTNIPLPTKLQTKKEANLFPRI